MRGVFCYDIGMKKRGPKHIIGIDEVGRGPLAGPVAVGVVKFKVESLKVNATWTRGFSDSKKLTQKAREEWMVKIEQARSEGWLEYSVVFVAPSVIDKKGIVHAISTALGRALNTTLGGRTSKCEEVLVLLDGGLYAPACFKNQKTIVKGDEKEFVIALASIVAKVTRDKRMVALAKRFPQSGFEQHKGYGTRKHYKAIKKHGLTPHHRKSFI